MNLFIIIINILSLCCYLLFCDCDEGVTIPLFRHKSPREIGMNINNIGDLRTDWLKPKIYNSRKPNPGPTNDSVALYRYLDSQFYGVIQIGTKARPFNLVMDTTWGHTWVISEDCSYRSIGCWFHNKYDHTKSSSYVEDGTKVNINMVTYNISGVLSKDIFHMQQLQVTNQTFLEVDSLPPIYALTKADGILGLAYSSLANGINPVFYNLIKQKRIKRALFSVYLNRDPSSDRGGNVIFGRIENRHILNNGNITYLPVNQASGYWQFKMDRIAMDNGKKTFPFCNGGCQAIADTGSNTIYGPEIEIQKINRLIKARYIRYGRYQINCATINILPEISFMIAGKNFTLHGRDYVQQMTYNSFQLCLSAFSTAATIDKGTWVLGGAFLTEFYSVYDLEHNRIGFVKAA